MDSRAYDLITVKEPFLLYSVPFVLNWSSLLAKFIPSNHPNLEISMCHLSQLESTKLPGLKVSMLTTYCKLISCHRMVVLLSFTKPGDRSKGFVRTRTRR
jgi:hypothetical protein